MADGTQVRRVLLQIKTDDGDTEEKLDRINAKADELKEKHPELSVKIDSAAASAKLGVLRQELKDVGKPVEAKIEPKLDKGAAAEVVAEAKTLADVAGKEAGTSGGQSAASGLSGGFSAGGPLIGAAVAVALAALPGVAGLAGTGMGVAMIGGMAAVVAKSAYSNVAPAVNAYQQALNTVGQAHATAMKQFASYYDALSGSQQRLVDTVTVAENAWQNFVQSNTAGMTKILSQGIGLLPKLFTGMSGILQSVLPQMSGIVKTLGGTLSGLLGIMRASAPAFGPMISSLLQMVNNVFPGLQAIIRATIPAMGIFSQILTGLGTSLSNTLSALIPGVRSSAQVLLGLGQTIGSLLPVIATLASDLAKLLAPIMSKLGATVMPQLTGALTNILNAVAPLLGPIGQLIAIIAQFTDAPMVAGLDALSNILVNLQGPIQTIAGMLQNLVSWAATAMSWLSRVVSFSTGGIIKLGGAAGAGGSLGGPISPGLSGPELGGVPGGASYGGISIPSLGGIAGGINTGPTSYGSRTTRPAAANLTLILAQGIMAGLTGTAGQVAGAIGKLLSAIATDVSGKYLTTAEGTAISKWLEADGHRLEQLANRRARILATIAKADAYSANIVSSTESTFGVVAAAQSITPALGVGGILRQLFGDVAQIRTFRSNIAKLRRMGLNKAYIDQLIQAGPVTGGQVAAELAAGNEGDIRQVNRAESQIAQASISLGQTAANAMYDTGKGAGKGFLSGLESQQKQIEQEMKKIAGGLVREMARIEIHLTGGDREFRAWLKKSIRITGGNVTVVGA